MTKNTIRTKWQNENWQFMTKKMIIKKIMEKDTMMEKKTVAKD